MMKLTDTMLSNRSQELRRTYIWLHLRKIHIRQNQSMMKGARVVVNFGEVITGKGHNFWMLAINLLFLDRSGLGKPCSPVPSAPGVPDALPTTYHCSICAGKRCASERLHCRLGNVISLHNFSQSDGRKTTSLLCHFSFSSLKWVECLFKCLSITCEIALALTFLFSLLTGEDRGRAPCVTRVSESRVSAA